MRYDTAVYFVKKREEIYNPGTGDYEAGTPSEVQRMASVMDTTEKMLTLVYGSIKEGSLTIQLQNAYDGVFDFIRIGDKKYAVDYRRTLRVKQTFVVSEVQ